jgi:hypothetical protein
VLAFQGQHAFALGAVIAFAEYPGLWWPTRLVATAEEDRLNIWRDLYTSFAAASDSRTIAIYERP